MSNSPLVKYTKLSPNHSGKRTHAIDTITIHCVVGHVSLETLGNLFFPSARQTSSNYGVDDNGKVGLYVNEGNRSWCSSNNANDQRAVTIEVASDKTHPYKITDGALNGVIALCADICKRNGIKKLLWKGDKTLIGQVDKQNMTVHRWFSAKACPGDYIYGKLGYIADEVNKKLGVAVVPAPPVFKPYIAKVTASVLNIRQEPSSASKDVGDIYKGAAYTIVAEQAGYGSVKGWGKLKSGAGWVSLDHMQFVRYA